MNLKNFILLPAINIFAFAQSSATNSRIPEKDIPRIYSVIKVLQKNKYPNNPIVGTAKADPIQRNMLSITEKWTVLDSEGKPYFYRVEYIDRRQNNRDIKITYFDDNDRTTP